MEMTPEEIKSWNDRIMRWLADRNPPSDEGVPLHPFGPDARIISNERKPFLTAADIVFLRELKVGL